MQFDRYLIDIFAVSCLSYVETMLLPLDKVWKGKTLIKFNGVNTRRKPDALSVDTRRLSTEGVVPLQIVSGGTNWTFKMINLSFKIKEEK